MATSPHGKIVRIGRIGDLKVVTNQNPKLNAAKNYTALRVQEESGREISLLFTENELQRARARAIKNPEDVPAANGIFDKIRDLVD